MNMTYAVSISMVCLAIAVVGAAMAAAFDKTPAPAIARVIVYSSLSAFLAGCVVVMALYVK